MYGEEEDERRYNDDLDYKEMQADYLARREQLADLLKEEIESELQVHDNIVDNYDLTAYLNPEWGAAKIRWTAVMDGEVATVITIQYGIVYLDLKVGYDAELISAEIYSQPTIYSHESRQPFTAELWTVLNNFFNS